MVLCIQSDWFKVDLIHIQCHDHVWVASDISIFPGSIILSAHAQDGSVLPLVY